MSRSTLLLWLLFNALSEAMIFYPPFPPPGQYHEPPPSQPIPPNAPSHVPQRSTYHQQSLMSLLQLYLNGMRAPQYIHVPKPPQVITLSEQGTEAEGGVTPAEPVQEGQNIPEGGALMEGQPTGQVSSSSQVQQIGSFQHGAQLPQSVQLQQGVQLHHGSNLAHGTPVSQGPQMHHGVYFRNGPAFYQDVQQPLGSQLQHGFQLPNGAPLAGVPSGLPNSAGDLGNLGGLVIGSDTGGPQPLGSTLPPFGSLPSLPPPGFRRPTIYNLQNNVPNNPLPIAQIRTQFYERLCYQTQPTMMPMIQAYLPGFRHPMIPGDIADPPACSCIPFNDCESAAHRFINEKTKDECGSTLTGFACCCEEPQLIGK